MGESGKELDETTLPQLADSVGADGVADLLATFLEDLRDRGRDLRDGLARSDNKLVERAVHSLKSASAYVGAMDFSRLCATLEVLASAGDLRGVAAQQSEFERRLARVESELLAYRQS